MKPMMKAVAAIVSLGLVMLAACTTGPSMGVASDVVDAAGMAAYRLGPGDEIKVTVYDEPDLSGSFVVDGQGRIAMSLVGQVQVGQLTLDEAASQLEARLKDGFLREPQVTAELVKGRPYYILGEINKPGEYPFVSGLTVMNAIASAGDFTYRADKSRILIKRKDSPNEVEVELTPTTPVQPGDTIRIRERFF